MKENCLEIGIIQAFLDGELSHEETAKVSSHMAVCDACANSFAEADDEAAIVFPALERELNTLVPTQRLWNKINDSIAAEKQATPWWHKAFAFISMTLANPSLAAAASIVIVVGVFSAVWINRTTEPTAVAPTNVAATSPAAKPGTSVNDIQVSSVPDTVSTPGAMRYERVAFKAEPRRITAAPAVSRSNAASYADPLAGESSYVNTISTLSKTVEEKKDGVLRPAQRIAFERDMAVVDDSIAKMKQEVKRNPKNETARQVLYSSYQNKIDLLNSVAQKEELMASIK
jgi:anti-sigma factor RsiW